MNNFEKLFKEYKEISEKLTNTELPLEEAINLYEKSNTIYHELKDILINAKQRVNNIKDNIN